MAKTPERLENEQSFRAWSSFIKSLHLDHMRPSFRREIIMSIGTFIPKKA